MLALSAAPLSPGQRGRARFQCWTRHIQAGPALNPVYYVDMFLGPAKRQTSARKLIIVREGGWVDCDLGPPDLPQKVHHLRSRATEHVLQGGEQTPAPAARAATKPGSPRGDAPHCPAHRTLGTRRPPPDPRGAGRCASAARSRYAAGRASAGSGQPR